MIVKVDLSIKVNDKYPEYCDGECPFLKRETCSLFNCSLEKHNTFNLMLRNEHCMLIQTATDKNKDYLMQFVGAIYTPAPFDDVDIDIVKETLIVRAETPQQASKKLKKFMINHLKEGKLFAEETIQIKNMTVE